MSDPLQLGGHFVILDAELAAETIEVSDTLWSELDEKYGDFSGRSLISWFSFDADWPTWERHPAGDEFVCLIDGDVELVLAYPDGNRAMQLSTRGAFAIVPKGVWHTARVHAPSTMLFVTPGQGTVNADQPENVGA